MMHKMTESMQTGLLDIQVLKSWVFSQRSLNILFFCSSTGDGRKVQGTFTNVEVRYSPSLERGAEMEERSRGVSYKTFTFLCNLQCSYTENLCNVTKIV